MSLTDKEIESILFNYKYFLNSIIQREQSIFYPFIISDQNTGGGRSGRISNPTQNTAIALTEEENQEIAQYVKAVQATYSNQPVDRKRMMEVYYFERGYGMREKDVASRLNTDRSNLWRWRRKVCKELRRQIKIQDNNKQNKDT